MRLYFDRSPWTNKKRLVIESNILLAHNKRSRGAALGWVILHKNREYRYKAYAAINSEVVINDYQEEWLCSDSGCKTLERVLRHEHLHCDRQVKDGIIGFIKWMYKYKKDKTFHEEEERLARQAEHG